MKGIIYLFSLLLLIFFISCNEEEKLSWLVNEIMKNPNKIDSICKSNSCEFISEKKVSYINDLIRIKNKGEFRFVSYEEHLSNYNLENVEWKTITISNSKWDDLFKFDFRKNDSKWELIDIKSTIMPID